MLTRRDFGKLTAVAPLAAMSTPVPTPIYEQYVPLIALPVDSPIGLGVGAMFVRSFTLMLVYRGTLEAYRYLEHGAFWAIGALAAIMFIGVHMHIPETFTGLIGAVLIGAAFWSSLRHNRIASSGS